MATPLQPSLNVHPSLTFLKRRETARQESVRFGGHRCQWSPAVSGGRDEDHWLDGGSGRPTPNARPRTDSGHAGRRRVCGCSLLLVAVVDQTLAIHAICKASPPGSCRLCRPESQPLDDFSERRNSH